MKYRKLGRSGLMVSEIALGTMIFGEDSKRSTPPKKADEIIARFLDQGGNHVDTANVYASGRSEEIVGKAIKKKREKVVLATKLRFPMGEGQNDQGLSRYHIIHSVEDSLRRLGLDTIDLLYMHAWDPLTPIEESLRAFDDLVTAGKVRYIGVSNFKAWQVMKSLGVSRLNNWVCFTAAQYQYSLVTRDIEHEFSDLCESEGLGIVPWGPLGGGFLTGKYQQGKRPQKASQGRIAVMDEGTEEHWDLRSTEKNWKILELMAEIADAHQCTFSQIAISWLLSRPGVCSVLVGARTLDQLNENLGAVDLQLSDQQIEQLNQASEPASIYPYRFIKNYAMR
jgi:aryl-alcohol dehydrogenase-like predicted oxidoreductase